MKLSDEQKAIFKRIAISIIVSILLIYIGVVFNPFGFTNDSSRHSALAIPLIILSTFIAISILRVAKRRFISPKDRKGSGFTEGSHKTKVLQALVQNTIEQSTLAFFVYSAWAIFMPVSSLSVIILAAGIFAIGRILFFIGYSNGASARALGFTLTFFPTTAMLLYATIWLIYKHVN